MMDVGAVYIFRVAEDDVAVENHRFQYVKHLQMGHIPWWSLVVYGDGDDQKAAAILCWDDIMTQVVPEFVS